MTKQTKKVQDDTQIKSSKICEVFKMVKDKENKVVIVAGDRMVSNKKFDTFKQAEEYISTKPYDLIFNTCLIMINLMKEEKITKDTKEADKVSEDNQHIS